MAGIEETGRFVADESGSVYESEYVVTGVRDRAGGQYLTFQRSLLSEGGGDDDDDDCRIHIEFNDQINSGYDNIRCCKLSRTVLELDLTEPIGRARKWSSFVIDLRLDEQEWAALAMGLRCVFEHREDLLSVESAS